MRTSPAPLLLELDLTEPLLESQPTDPIGWAQARRRSSLRSVLDGLRDAADDPRVRGLIAKIGGPLSLARAQELAGAVRTFRQGGKPAVAWAETYGEFGPGSAQYLLATAFGEVWLQPSGDVGLTGVAVEALFLRGALDRLGIVPQLGQRHEYKNAADAILRHGFSDAHRESAGRIAESGFDQVVSGVAENRGLSADAVRALADRAPVAADSALEAGLVDRLGYRDEVYADLRKRLGDEVELRYVSRYERTKKATKAIGRVRHRSKPAVALITGTGAIMLGRPRRNPLARGSGIGSDVTTAAIRAAVRDDQIKAIVFRVDSPGGSYVASDAIWREVGQARAAGKPVVVSMGDVAGSGGYYVAMNADAIVAQPGTLTGSIGVFGGKAVTAGLLEKLSLAPDAVSSGGAARMFSPRTPFTEAEWQRLQGWLDRVYDDFVAKAAAGRGMARDRMHELARGRVWTGADAHERGLVDQLGGLELATELARRKAGLPDDAELRRFPQSAPLEFLSAPKSSEDKGAAGPAYAGWGVFADLAGRLGLPAEGPLTMPFAGPLKL